MNEFELRGRLTEEEYQLAREKLRLSFEEVKNNKTSQFFTFRGGILKVSRLETTNQVVLSLKLGDETKNNLKEYESLFKVEAWDEIIHMLELLGYQKSDYITQKRIDFHIDTSTVISLKYTADWGYHFEAEKTFEDDHSSEKVRLQLTKLCKTYGLKPMSPAELGMFLKSIKAKK